MQCPCRVGTVRDLHRNSLAVAGGRPRTKANETEIETTRAVSSSWDDVFSLRQSLSRWSVLGMGGEGVPEEVQGVGIII